MIAISAVRETQYALPLVGGEGGATPPSRLEDNRPQRKKLARLVGNFDLTLPLFESDHLKDLGITTDCAVLYDHETEVKAEHLSYMDTEEAGENEEACSNEEESPPWTHDGIVQLHGVLLDESLAALAARGNAEQKKEILRWIFEADFFADRWETGGKVMFTKDLPWTFAFCCKLAGEDPDVYRDYICRRLKSAS